MRRVILADGVELYCGDCREILPAIGKADAIVSDPPYEVTPTSIAHYKPGGSMIRSGWMGESYPIGHGLMFEVPAFSEWARLAFEACKADADAYFMVNDKKLCEMQAAMFAAGWQLHNLLAWRKPTGIPNRWYFKNLEFCLYLWKGQAKTIRMPSSTQLFDAPHVETRVHNSQKPVSLMGHYILNSSDPGECILDPFMGSGTTGVAAVRLGRRFTGIELDPKHFETACRRIGEALRQPDLFIEEPRPARQETMF